MQMHMYYRWILGLLLLLVVASTASGQVVPDTVYRKPSLPTGPPGEVPQPQRPPARPRQPVEVPPVQEQPPAEPQDNDDAAYEERVSLTDKLYFGGGLGLQFGTYTNLSLAPIIGVMVTEKFWAGGGIMYDYLSAPGISLQNIGGKGFVQFEFVNNFLVHAEYDLLNVEKPYLDSNNRIVTYREMVGIPLAGLGYRQRIGSRATADILVLYNFGPSSYGLYSNPVIRASFNIPFKK